MMKKLLFFLLFAVFTMGISAQPPMKKCPTCGLSIPKCQYKGKHPKKSPTKQPCKQSESTNPVPSRSSSSSRPTTGYENGHQWVDLGLSVKWATCNIGASSPSDVGGYYSWGEIHSTKNGDGRGYNPNYTYKDNPIILKNIAHSKYDVATSLWGGTWSIPTEKQMKELVNKCQWKWTDNNGATGYLIKGPNGKSIFLPANFGPYDSLKDIGTDGNYWCSDWTLSDQGYACHLVFIKNVRNFRGSNRSLTYSVRPVCK